MSTTKTILQIQSEIENLSPHPNRVTLMAVSKKQPVEKIRKLIRENQFVFGENYVQEALEKMESISEKVEWHLIGHLQSKKVNSIIGKFACIHSIDSLKIANLISEKSRDAGLVQNVFIEVNLGNEESKTGFPVEELKMCWSKIIGMDSICVTGLMALPPASDDLEITRSYFKMLRSLLAELKAKTYDSRHPMDQLSMGTSQDYLVALEEGSTLIRIGTTLFGERL